MNTQTHVIIGALLTGKSMSRLAWAGALGGVIPDVPMYIAIGGLSLQGYSLEKIFDEFYWNRWWQIANAIGHNFLIWGSLAAVSGILLSRSNSFVKAFNAGSGVSWIFALSISALIHSIIDFLVHRDDGHMHFWPLTEWRFQSPISYWDPNFYGRYFGVFEASLGILIAVVLFKRYRNTGLRIALGAVAVLYVAVPAFFYLFHHGG